MTTPYSGAAGVQLGTGWAVLAIGGFNGTDPSPTLAEFQRLVARGEIHYYLAGGLGGPGGDSGTGSQITDWVEQNFTARTVNNTTLYDLTP